MSPTEALNVEVSRSKALARNMVASEIGPPGSVRYALHGLRRTVLDDSGPSGHGTRNKAPKMIANDSTR